jgi:3'-5' exoribonuclease
MNHGTVVDYTTPGKLLGHIYQGAELLWEKLRAIPNFPETLRTHLMHCLLAHHGELENGSPVVPKTLEAFVLHLIDNLDSQTAALVRITRELRDEGKEWSDRIDLIGRAVWSGGNSDT